MWNEQRDKYYQHESGVGGDQINHIVDALVFRIS
jgi:hypothetical protein